MPWDTYIEPEKPPHNCRPPRTEKAKKADVGSTWSCATCGDIWEVTLVPIAQSRSGVAYYVWESQRDRRFDNQRPLDDPPEAGEVPAWIV